MREKYQLNPDLSPIVPIVPFLNRERPIFGPVPEQPNPDRSRTQIVRGPVPDCPIPNREWTRIDANRCMRNINLTRACPRSCRFNTDLSPTGTQPGPVPIADLSSIPSECPRSWVGFHPQQEREDSARVFSVGRKSR
jgi:hypothetical protein